MSNGARQVGKYTLLKKIATGGMAEIYLARQAGPAGFEKLVVLKRILDHLTERALVTVRYGEPRSFSMFMARAVKPGGCRHQPEATTRALVECVRDRTDGAGAA